MCILKFLLAEFSVFKNVSQLISPQYSAKKYFCLLVVKILILFV